MGLEGPRQSTVNIKYYSIFIRKIITYHPFYLFLSIIFTEMCTKYRGHARKSIEHPSLVQCQLKRLVQSTLFYFTSRYWAAEKDKLSKLTTTQRHSCAAKLNRLSAKCRTDYSSNRWMCAFYNATLNHDEQMTQLKRLLAPRIRFFFSSAVW